MAIRNPRNPASIIAQVAGSGSFINQAEYEFITARFEKIDVALTWLELKGRNAAALILNPCMNAMI